MKTRRLTATAGDGRTDTSRTASPYTHVVFYLDGRRPTWHTSRELAEKRAGAADDVVRCEEA